MKRVLHLLSIILFAAVADLKAQAEEPHANRPNVIILLTDDQGTLDANCYGSTDLKTPNMDKLAASGIRFTQAYAHTVCCPARAALFTGRHPQRSGIISWTQGDRHGSDQHNTNMPTSEVTLAEVMKSTGYRTALLVNGTSVPRLATVRSIRDLTAISAISAVLSITTDTSSFTAKDITTSMMTMRKFSDLRSIIPRY